MIASTARKAIPSVWCGVKGLKKVVLRAGIASWNWLWKNGDCLLYQIHFQITTHMSRLHISWTYASSYLAKPCRPNASIEMWTGSKLASYIISTTAGGVFTEELLFLRMHSELEEYRRIHHTNSILHGCIYAHLHLVVLNISRDSSRVNERWLK